MAESASQTPYWHTDAVQFASSNLSDDDSHDLEHFSVVASNWLPTELSKRQKGIDRDGA
jgi:hypothetical protein